ncbi:TetR/AcrR family transcriptional regulator [Actinomadura harenae]|uniref:TetR/AcrR family transcriptional regulator n=1 Tax=Actinomadura harenae TaxID=2483351 RepID=A0A3M2LY09_9ACTN|nr:TetR/AcrR family transcriptional regulator [Actinomadura harenae]RMI41800.1 TetR/AcrR family transcriptional regulator [Actinomadura harenae]
MARRPSPQTRERILDAANDLFDRYGVHAVGMQRIIDEAACGKNLLYREFGSKDELVVAYLERGGAEWDVKFARALAAAATPQEQLVELVRVVGAGLPGTRGCGLRNTLAEYPDPDHPVHRFIVEHLEKVRGRLHDLAARTPTADPDRLVDRILLIINGLYSPYTVIAGEGRAAAEAVLLAREIVSA